MNEKEKALIPLEEKEVVFYEDRLLAVLIQENAQAPKIYVPVKPIADALGLSWAGQSERIRRDEVLADEMRLIRMTRINPEGGRPDHLCLPLDFLPGWLFGVQATRVKPELKEKVLLFKRECYKVLSEAFQEGRLTATPSMTELLQSDSPAAQAYKMAMAIMEMARNQLILESRLEVQGRRLDSHDERLEMIESQLGNESHAISQDQAVQISQAVKAIAMVWSKQMGKNQYGSVYGRFYQQFNITSYKLLPNQKFPSAMNWLTQWYKELTDGADVPF